MWVEVVGGSLPEGFSPGSPLFLPPQKPTSSTSNLIRREDVNELEFGDVGRKTIDTRIGQFLKLPKTRVTLASCDYPNYYIHFEITGDLAVWLALSMAIYSPLALFATKTKQRIRFQGLFKSNQSNCRKASTFVYSKSHLFLFCVKPTTGWIKDCYGPKSYIVRFQNRCSKVVIDLVECNFALKSYVVSNRTLATHSFDFDFRQITLH